MKPERYNQRTGTAQPSIKMILFSAGICLLLLFSPLGVGLALAPVIDLALGQHHMVIYGDQANGYLSEISASGDFNKDGFKDLLLGAAGRNQFAGAAFMILGSANPASTIYLFVNQANLTVLGAGNFHALGHSVAAGDVNGDGYDDMIVSADGFNSGRGAVYVFLGGPDLTGPAVVNLASSTSSPNASPALTILGASAENRLGRSVASGDVNGDGIADIIIGAYKVSLNERIEAGAVYVILGNTGISAAAPNTINLASTQAALTIYGESGAPGSLNPAGPVSKERLSPLFADELRQGAAELGDRLGRSVAVGDVNKDGIADIIAGAYGANVGANPDAGKTYVFYGSASYSSAAPQIIDLGANPAGANIALNGVDANDQSGFYVASGDLNNDGFDDILTSAYFSQGVDNAAAEAGEAYVVYGGSSLPATINLATNASLTIYGAAAGDRLGRSLAAGDVNGDGYVDLILGASRADPNGRQDAGTVYVINGRQNIPSPILLNDPAKADVRILGAASSGVSCEADSPNTIDCSDEAGHSSGVGDINGDGVADVVVGALFANQGNLQDAGAIYVIFGGSGSNPPPPSNGRFLYMPVLYK